MLGNVGVPELMIIFLFILIFFGAKKIPDMAKGLGQGVREFRKAMREMEDVVTRETGSDASVPRTPLRSLKEPEQEKEIQDKEA